MEIERESVETRRGGGGERPDKENCWPPGRAELPTESSSRELLLRDKLSVNVPDQFILPNCSYRAFIVTVGRILAFLS
jgi:hypothetical protein